MKKLRLSAFVCAITLVTLAGSARAQPQTSSSAYPEPRFPGYLRTPDTVDEIMPIARRLVREAKGLQGDGLGIAKRGDVVAVISNSGSQPVFIQAIQRAYAEVGVTLRDVPDYSLVGLNRADAEEVVRYVHDFTGKDGAAGELRRWIDDRFPNPAEPKAWLKERMPEDYAAIYPEKPKPDAKLAENIKRMHRNSIATGIRTYLEEHPEVRGVFWGTGGTTGRRRSLHPLESKYLGTFVYDNPSTVMSRVSDFRGDVWRLIEEKTIEPLGYAAQVDIKDPEGTDLAWELTDEMASRWAAGVYQQGHLYMHPNQATGRFPYSLVEYPSFTRTYNPREPMPDTNGVIAGTANHAGYYSRVVVNVEHGYVTRIDGDGLYARVWNAFLKYPGINETKYPYHNKPGYWWLYEAALGTNPKFFRDPADLLEGSNSAERNRSGVLHFGHGIRIHHSPDSMTHAQEWEDFFKTHNLPDDHWLHVHNYFATYRLRVRETDVWIPVIEKGRLKALDDPAVRALASRYGDPDQILAEEWVPEMPGVNVPGDYKKDYAPNPWPTVERVLYKEVPAGTYRYAYPKPAQSAPAR
ncbi:MAG TPA: hypothetical protein VL966_02050 [Alphaproteobacteria bacterium]|jgi:hypothetical protein|nr:hypothetical protein [Alphaproteobacteria bacterium]